MLPDAVTGAERPKLRMHRSVGQLWSFSLEHRGQSCARVSVSPEKPRGHVGSSMGPWHLAVVTHPLSHSERLSDPPHDPGSPVPSFTLNQTITPSLLLPESFGSKISILAWTPASPFLIQHKLFNLQECHAVTSQEISC